MRETEELRLWGKLARKHQSEPASRVSLSEFDVELARPCLVVGGLNGSGKSRLLREIDGQLGDQAVLIRLHELCEQVLRIARARADIMEMTEEFEPFEPPQDVKADLERIIRRAYDSVVWYSLDFTVDGLVDAALNEALGDGDGQISVPFFTVVYRGASYNSLDMGLGELSVHLLFWMLWRLQDTDINTLLLDEPDAYLPPVGAGSLVPRLLARIDENNWSLVLASHSQEIIESAAAHNAFTYLFVDGEGVTGAVSSSQDPLVHRHLVRQPEVSATIFVEDESAMAQLEAILDTGGNFLLERCTIVWGGGDGYLRKLHEKMPRPPRPRSFFGFVLDADQRVLPTGEGRWPVLNLPGELDPDEAFMAMPNVAAALSEVSGVPLRDLLLFLGTLEGADAHDWVNRLGDRFGRPKVLAGLGRVWASQNAHLAREFVTSLRTGWGW